MAPRADITGKRYNKWVAEARGPDYLARGGTQFAGARWWCRCDCGVRKLVHLSNLQSGQSKSCGHGRRTGGRNPGKNMTGPPPLHGTKKPRKSLKKRLNPPTLRENMIKFGWTR